MTQRVFNAEPVRTRHRSVYRRRRFVVFGGGTLALLLLVYLIGVVIAPVPAATAVLAPIGSLSSQAAQLEWPGGGQGAIMAPDYPEVSASTGGSGAVPIASITKVVAALVILDKKPISGESSGPSITFTDNDVDILNEVVANGGSWAPVVAGTSMTERQALTAMLVPSGSNYALSLANWAFGSMSAYVSAARTWLAAHNLTGTTIVSPDGLDPDNASTTKDLLRLGQMVVDSPVLSSIVSQQNTEKLPGAGVQQNTNQLLGIDGIDGIKTGNTDQAGYCLLFSALVPVGTAHVRVIGVILGAPDDDTLWSDVKSLVESTRAGFHQLDLAEKGRVFGSYQTSWGARSDLVALSQSRVVVWSDTKVTPKTDVRALTSGNAGDVMGTVTYTIGAHTQVVKLGLRNAVPGPGLGWRLGHPFGIGS